MASIYVSKLQSKKSTGSSFSLMGCLKNCFRREKAQPEPQLNEIPSKVVEDYGSTKSTEHLEAPENEAAGKVKGTRGVAYAYDEGDSSDDSDDEVLRRYHQSLQKGEVPTPAGTDAGADVEDGLQQGSKCDITDSPAETKRLTEVKTRDEVARSLAAGSPSPRNSINSVEGRVSGSPGTSGLENPCYQEEGVSPDHHSQTSALSQGADTASTSMENEYGEQDEHLFDVSDLQDREPPIISKCGNLEVTFSYDADKSRMNIIVHKALEIPSKDRGGASNAQVRLLLLPVKKVRHKTKIKPGENPEFEETFQCKVSLDDVNNCGVRFRLYGCERMRRERMIGETVVGFASLNLDMETTHMLTLEPRSNLSHGDSRMDVSSLSRSDSASSTQSMQHGGMPELLLGLSYNGTTGRLSCEVIKGSNFRNMAMNRAPDTYVKLTLMSPNGSEIARSKTSIRRGQPNPLYKETFMFQVALFQLPDVTLMTSVYNKRSMKRKEMIGWFSLGLNNSGEEESSHWTDMRESKGEQVCRWHVLLES